jgi:predicted nucleic acid-binding protein
VIVVDASAILSVLIADTESKKIEELITAEDWLVAPELIDVEIVNALRRLERLRSVTAPHAVALLSQYLRLRLLRFSATELIREIWRMRHGLTAYDAAYVALAQSLDLPLYTRDTKLAATAGHGAKIILI